MTRFIIACLAVLALSSPTVCSAKLGATPQKTQELMARSGLNEQVAQIPRTVLYGIDQANRQSRQPLPPEIQEKLRGAVLSNFRTDEMLRIISQHIDNNLNSYDLDAILHWLDSPLGMKITRLEEAASTPEAYEAMEAMKGDLLKDPARVKKMEELDAAVGSTELSLDLQVNTQVAVTSAFAAAMAPDDNTIFERIAAAAEAGRRKMEPSAREKTIVSMLYAYRTLTDDEIDRYIAFSSSDLGRIYSTTVSQGVKNAMMSAARGLGKSFVQILR